MWSCGGNRYGQLGIGAVPRIMEACRGFLKLLPLPQVRWRHLRRSLRKQLSRPQQMLLEPSRWRPVRPRIVDFALLGGSASRTRGTHGIEAVEGLEQGAPAGGISGSLEKTESDSVQPVFLLALRCGAHHVICLTRPPGTARYSEPLPLRFVHCVSVRHGETSQVMTEGWSGRASLGWEESKRTLEAAKTCLSVSGGVLLLEGSPHLGARPTAPNYRRSFSRNGGAIRQ